MSEQRPPSHGWTPGLAGGNQDAHVSTPGLPPTPRREGEQQGYASTPGLLPDAHPAPHQPYGGPYRPFEEQGVQPGLMPDHGSSPANRPPGAPDEAFDEQMPPGGWDRPLVDPGGGDRADFGSRAMAMAIDGVIWFAASLFLALLLGVGVGLGALASDDSSVLGAGGIAIGLASFAVYAAYTGRLMTRDGPRNGQTFGKQLMGVRVVRVDGRPVRLGTVAVRNWLMKYLVFGVLAAATLYIATLVNYLRGLSGEEGRTWHDQAAGTRVVRA